MAAYVSGASAIPLSMSKTQAKETFNKSVWKPKKKTKGICYPKKAEHQQRFFLIIVIQFALISQ